MDDNLTVSQSSDRSAPRPGKLSRILKSAVCLMLAAFGVYVIGNLGSTLYVELRALSDDWAEARDRDPIGYIGISSEHPDSRPSSCVREDQDRTYLWAGNGVKSQASWFDVTGTDLPLRQFRFAFGRDKIKTIDYPIFQTSDDAIARKIYPEREVLGLELEGEVRAYPLGVMEKVEVVNETIGGRDIAVTYCSLLERAVVYERSLDGEPISFGTSGYCYQEAFVLYDRATDSLWHPGADGLTAITGRLAGKVLREVTRPKETTWGEWRRRHPRTLVLVGGDRSRGIPLPAPPEVATRPL